MGAILLIEWAAADGTRRQEASQRLAALAQLDSARLLFAAADAGAAEPALVVAVGFPESGRAQAALSRWRAEGALPEGARARVLAQEGCDAGGAPLLLFP